LEQALARRPDFPEALERLGILLARMGEYARAVAVLKRWTRHRPTDVQPYYLIAGIHARQHHAPEAVNWLKKAVAMGFRDRRLLAHDPNFGPIRETALFQSLLLDMEKSDKQ